MELIIAALTLGMTAGLKPGPLGIYVIHQTLLHGARSGLLASFAPFVSDGPIILGSFLLVNTFKQYDILHHSHFGTGSTLYCLYCNQTDHCQPHTTTADHGTLQFSHSCQNQPAQPGTLYFLEYGWRHLPVAK